jgi:hypothetical protein
MPKIKLTFSETNPMPEALKAFKVSDTEAEVWVGANDLAVAGELNPTLEAHKNTILLEKNNFENQYKALVQTTSGGDVATAKRIAELEAKAQQPQNSITEDEKKLLDAIKEVKPDATPDFVKEAVKEYPVVTEKLTVIETDKVNNAVYEASGYKNRTVFDTVYKNPALNPNFDSIVWKDEKDAQDNPVKVPYVKVKNPVEGKVELPFGDYVKATPEWNPFMASLTDTNQQQQTWTAAPPQNQQFQQQQPPVNPMGQPTNSFLDAIETGQKVMATNAAAAAAKEKTE